MTASWRRHLIVCCALALIAGPIYFLDQALFKPGGGNWITLDFRGLLFWSYIGWLAIYLVLSSIVLPFFPGSRRFGFQLGLMILSLVLLVSGALAYGRMQRWNTNNQDRALMVQKAERLRC